MPRRAAPRNTTPTPHHAPAPGGATRRRPRTRQRLRAAAALTAGALALAACSSGDTGTGTAENPDASTLPTGIARVAAPPVPAATPVTPALTVTDPAGTVLTLPARPQRIVCITGACDDMLFSLGLRPVGTSTPALLTRPEYLGEAAREITTIPGSFGSEDVEKIASLHPDLVIGLAGVHEELRPAISRHAPLWTLRVESIDDSIADLRALATLTARPDEQVRTETAFAQTRADARATSVAHHLGDVVALSMYSSGAGRGVNTSDDLLGELVATVFRYPWPSKGGGYATAQAYDTEEILQQNPAIIYVQSFTGGGARPASEELAADPAWRRISAVEHSHVVEVPTALWSSGRGPHALGLVLDQILAGPGA